MKEIREGTDTRPSIFLSFLLTWCYPYRNIPHENGPDSLRSPGVSTAAPSSACLFTIGEEWALRWPCQAGGRGDHLGFREPALLHGSSSPGGRHSLKLQLVRKTAGRSRSPERRGAVDRPFRASRRRSVRLACGSVSLPAGIHPDGSDPRWGVTPGMIPGGTPPPTTDRASGQKGGGSLPSSPVPLARICRAGLGRQTPITTGTN